jgi:hypothetical protein
MDGIKFKRAISATLERYTAALGYKVRIVYVGQSAGMNFVNGQLNVIFPAIDETLHFTIADVNRYVAMVIHEGGHAKFTDCKAWDKATASAPKGQGALLHRLINGLEDPRMEQCVIDSKSLENSRNLLSDLTNWLLIDGYVEPDDIENVAFICAIEGRRLNGYQLNYPCIVDQSPWSTAIWDALHSARKARNTQGVVYAAQTLLDALLSDPQGEGKGKGQDTNTDGLDSTGESKGEGQGEQGEGEGEQGEGESEGEGKGEGKPIKTTPKGQQRSIEPLANVKGDVPVADSAVDRPHVGAPVISEIRLF